MNLNLTIVTLYGDLVTCVTHAGAEAALIVPTDCPLWDGSLHSTRKIQHLLHDIKLDPTQRSIRKRKTVHSIKVGNPQVHEPRKLGERASTATRWHFLKACPLASATATCRSTVRENGSITVGRGYPGI